MKFITTCIFALLLFCNAIGQKPSIDYSFMNAALKQLEVHDQNEILLSQNLCFGNLELRYFKEVKGKIDSLSFMQMVSGSRSIRDSLQLDAARLIHKQIKLINTKFIDSIQKGNGLLSIPNKNIFYTCSSPIFDHKKKYAFLFFGGGSAWNKMSGQHYMFKKTKKVWKLVATFGSWIINDNQ